MTEPNIHTVTPDNLQELGFFCYKSKPKSEGFRRKSEWLRTRMEEGLKIKILFEGERSVGFIETIPGEYSWRVVDAPNQLVIHCLWVVGRAKGKRYGSLLLQDCLAEAKREGKAEVTMVSSQGNWLASKRLFINNGFQVVDEAPPSFHLLTFPLKNLSGPSFPADWTPRARAFGDGMTVIYTDQCPYINNAVDHARRAFETRGISSRAVRLTSASEVRKQSPSPYGVFNIVLDGSLFAYHYLGTKEMNRLDKYLSST